MPRSRQAMLGFVALAVVLVVLGVAFQLGMFIPKSHAISNKAIFSWALAGVSLVGASFARPRP
jgi:hypothetical protein